MMSPPPANWVYIARPSMNMNEAPPAMSAGTRIELAGLRAWVVIKCH